MIGVDGAVARHKHHHAFDDIFQLTHIAGPGVGQERIDHRRAQLAARHL